MGTLRQYFDTDFSNTLRVFVTPRRDADDLEAVLHYDCLASTAFLSCYIPGSGRSYEYFAEIVQTLEYGVTSLHLAGKVVLPEIRLFPGDLQVLNKHPFEVKYRLYGDPAWRSTSDIRASQRVFLYAEADLSDGDISRLQDEAASLGHSLQFRSREYVASRTKREIPLAFVCHDSRDKEEVARPIAVGLQRMLCPVWYDEFSLTVGANLRRSIEKGLKECRKCILVLSQHFFSNDGWTRREFDSIFTREILEERDIVLPVWCDVDKHQVYDYSPSLLNVKGLNWMTLGSQETIRLLYNAIVPPLSPKTYPPRPST
jgi:hypothetical protein